jgi:hypothetical protein
MAGGSADAAAALVACDALWDTGLPRADLSGIAAELGSDVPFALLGHTAVGTGRGHLLTPAMTRGEFHWVFAVREDGLSTPAVFRRFDQLTAGNEHDVALAEETPLMQALRAGDPHALGAALHNDLEPAALSLRPELERTLALAREGGALGTLVSGSGPTVAALARLPRTAPASSPESVSVWLSGEAAAEGPGGGDPDHGFVGGGQGFVVAYQAAVLGQPAEGAFHDPAAAEQDEALGRGGTLDHGDGQSPDLLGVGDESAGVSAVGPHERDGGERLAQGGGDPERAVAVLQGGDGHHDRQEQPGGVGGDVAFTALVFFPASYPDVAFGTASAARTVWESITAAVGNGLRPSRMRA